MDRLRILITGFGPFPGAPSNPTERLVARLVRLRRPALADVALRGHVFHVSYGAVDRDLPALLALHQPHAVLMFGLAQRTPFVRIETRARNAVTTLWPDADQNRGRAAQIAHAAAADLRFGPHTARLLQAARQAGVWVQPSRDAGRYLCNYLSWRAIEASHAPGGPLLTAFIHVPPIARETAGRRLSPAAQVGFEELVDAGEALLMTTLALTRQRQREAARG